jgi:hypothetical protein
MVTGAPKTEGLGEVDSETALDVCPFRSPGKLRSKKTSLRESANARGVME